MAALASITILSACETVNPTVNANNDRFLAAISLDSNISVQRCQTLYCETSICVTETKKEEFWG